MNSYLANNVIADVQTAVARAHRNKGEIEFAVSFFENAANRSCSFCRDIFNP